MEEGHQGITHICSKQCALATGWHDPPRLLMQTNSPNTEYKWHFTSHGSININCVKRVMYCSLGTALVVCCLNWIHYIYQAPHCVRVYLHCSPRHDVVQLSVYKVLYSELQYPGVPQSGAVCLKLV